MVLDYINTEVEVATKNIKSFTQVRNQILTKEYRSRTTSSH